MPPPSGNESDDNEEVDRIHKGDIQAPAERSQTSTKANSQDNEPAPTGSSHVLDLLRASTNLLLPHALHPLVAIETFLPGLAAMWPFSNSLTFKPATDIPNLAGKVVLVTGGNTGIGKETVLQLAKHNPQKIFLAARTESKAKDAIASIKSQISEDVDIEHLPLDLSSLPSIKDAADRVISRSDRLDILVLNAGIMAVPPGKTASGQDIQLGTNHVGHFLLTKLLLPTLTRTAERYNPDVRVLSVSSEAWNMAPNLDTILSTERLTATGPWTRYGASKAANIMFASELARRYPTLTSVSLHPGIIKTDLYLPSTGANLIVKYGLMVVGPLMFQNVPTGASNQLWLAAGAKKEELVNGAYYTPVGKLRQNKWALDADAGKRLWEWTEQELKTAGY